MKLLVDTNVYLEFLLEREHFEDAFSFFQQSIIRQNQLVMTSMTIRDIDYVVHKYTHDNEKTRSLLMKAYSMTSKVVPISEDAAIESLYSENVDLEDALQAIAAEEAMCSAIITFDKKGFNNLRIPVFTPQEICEIWRKDV